MKNYTSIEQAKKLAEFLPLESADGFYAENVIITEPFITYLNGERNIPAYKGTIPCWSLAALLAVLPKGINISTPKPVNELGYCCWNQYDEIYASNPVDACYEMILKLHEQKLL